MLLKAAAKALRLLPPERAHTLTLDLLRAVGRTLPAAKPDPASLAVSVLGRTFPNPLGLAAGFDKDALVPDAMLRLGLGFVECGTVTPRPQAGNSKPRLFRLVQDRAVINRMGFNNRGMEAAARALARRKSGGIVGINIGANKESADRIADYRDGFVRLAPLADYVTVNISSPNTPGLRGLQNRDELSRLLDLLVTTRSKANFRTPLLLKIAPDLDRQALDDICDAALAFRIEGMIVSNTTIERPPTLKSPNAGESGGLSGAPLFVMSTVILGAVRERVGKQLVLIGAGGVASGAQAYAKIRAGASLVQLYTALALEGPALITRIKRELLKCLKDDRFSSVADAVGKDVD